MRIKVQEATITQLNRLVALASNLQIIKVVDGVVYTPQYPKIGGTPYRPTTDWSQGGPIIEREKLSVCPGSDAPWMACDKDALNRQAGPTPLIAAMRCFVASCRGNEVEVPYEIC